MDKNQTAILALVLNILILPGLGSIIGGKKKEGTWQIILAVVGLILSITIIGLVLGIPMMGAAWIWGIVTGVKLLQEAK